MLIAWIPLTLSHHLSLSAIALGKSSWWHAVSAQNWYFSILPTMAYPYIGDHKKTLLMCSFLLLHLYLTCLTCFTWLDCEIRGKCPHSCCFVGHCFQNSVVLIKITLKSENKMGIRTSWKNVSTIVWLHFLDFNNAWIKKKTCIYIL